MKKLWLLLLAVLLAGCEFPTPIPVNPPGSKNLRLVVIDRAFGRTPQNSAIVNQTGFWQSIRTRGHIVNLVDRANPVCAKYEAQLNDTTGKEKPLPFLIVEQRETGKILLADKLADTTERITNIVTHFEGRQVRGPPLKIDAGPEVYNDHNGIPRRMGLLPATPEMKQRRRAMKSFAQKLGEDGLAIISEAEWKDVIRPELEGPEFVTDQGQTSGCVGWSFAGAFNRSRVLRGMTSEQVSGAYIYSLCNHGQDAGAYIPDAMEAGMKYGICLRSEMDRPKIFAWQQTQAARDSAARRQLLIACPVDTIPGVATAIQLGYIVQCGVQVDGAFENFDGDGVSAARGKYANHSVHIYGMKKIGGRWRFLMGNSWGYQWGPFQNGSCFLNPEALCIDGEAFVHADSEWIESDFPSPPPPPKPQLSSNQKGLEHAINRHFVLAL